MLMQPGQSARKFISFALIAMMTLAALVTPATALAQSQTIQSSLTGVTITYGPQYELQDDGRYADDVMETMMFIGAADILAMGFMTPLIDLNGARDIMLETLFGEVGTSATIDRGDYSGVSYSLDMLNFDGQEMGVFSLFMNQRSHGFSEFYIFIAPPALFGATMQTAQSSFTVNGSPLMDGVDATVMGNLITANIGITGGTAVTDVTEVTQATDNTTETTQTTASDPTDTESANLNYVLLVMAEYSTVDTAIGTIFDLLQDLDDGVTDATTVRPLIDEQYAILAGTNDRIATIEVPAGMQDFHQETVAWSNAVTSAGTTWFDFVDGRTTSDVATEAMMAAIDLHIAFGDSLQAVNLTEGTSASNGTTDTTATEVATDTTQSSSTTADANAYLTIVQDHRGLFFVSLLEFNALIARMGEDPTDAEIAEIRNGSIQQAEYWLTFAPDAAALTPPAGYEDVHQQYMVWAGEVTELGNLWIGTMNQDGTSVDDFYDQLDIVLAADTELEAVIQASGSGTESETQTSQGSDTTESTETTGRTSRSASTTETDSTETTGRTSRSTGTTETNTTETTPETSGRTSRSSSAESTEEATQGTETTSRTSRTTRGGTDVTGDNTSETSGRSSTTTTTAANTWVMDVTGVSFTWNDDFALNTDVDEPQLSDLEGSEDKIFLQTTMPQGEVVRFNVTVYANSTTDSTSMVNVLINDSEALVDLFGEDAEIIDYEITDPESAILVKAVDSVGEYWVYAQVTCVTPDCDTIALLVLATEGDPLVYALSAMESGVAINGSPISSAIPLSDVEDAVNQFGN